MESKSVREFKEKIHHDEIKLQKLMSETQKIWEETGLDPKEMSYLVEKTMRFELAQKNTEEIFVVFKYILENYKNLCQELEKIKIE